MVRSIGRVLLAEPGPIQSLARKTFAQALGTMDIGASMDFAPGLSDLVLTKRNAVVIDVLKAERKKVSGRIAIFYGAAHMKDLARRLETELGHRRTSARWLRAWALRPALER